MEATTPTARGSELLGLDLAALTPFLDAALPDGLAGPLVGQQVSGGRSNPTYEISDGTRAWILRRPPHGHVLKSAHDMMRESRVVQALNDSAVPVATIVTSCPDRSLIGAPFYVMDKISGRTFRNRDETAALTEQQQRALSVGLVDTLVALHSIEPAAVGLSDFGRPDGYISRQLTRWLHQWESVRTRDAPGIYDLHRRLTLSTPELRRPGIVHGDYKIDNVMVDHADAGRILALLDWEMSTLGDTLADLGQLISFWDEPGGLYNPITAGATAHPGFLSGADVVQEYAHRTGVDVDNLDWYVSFADFKLAVILEQIHARYLAGHTVGDGFSDIGDMVLPILDRAADRASHSSDPRLRR